MLLDHGLYREIDDALRAHYAGLWRSLVFADADGIRAHSEAMNAGELYPLFAAILTQRPWEQVLAGAGAGAGGPLSGGSCRVPGGRVKPRHRLSAPLPHTQAVPPQAPLALRPHCPRPRAPTPGRPVPATPPSPPWPQIVDKRIDHLALPKTQEDKDMLQGYAQVGPGLGGWMGGCAERRGMGRGGAGRGCAQESKS